VYPVDLNIFRHSLASSELRSSEHSFSHVLFISRQKMLRPHQIRMSSSSTSAISTPAQPRTPDPSSPVVRITLPTRPSFSSHRARSFSITPSSPSKEDAPPKSAKGHGRSVSFSAQVDELDCQDEALRLYRIPQRQEVIEEDAIGSALPVSLDSETRIQRYPPKALSLSDKGYHRGPSSAILPFTRTAPSPSWSLGSAGVPSLSAVVPTQARGTRHSISEAPAIATSIWSAGIHTGAGSGWVSPALSSAQIVTKVTRQRGLSIALVKEGKEELLVEVPVSPGLGSSVPLKVGPVKAEENGEMPINLGLGNSVPLKAGAVTAESDTNSMTDSETEGGSLLGPLKTKAGGDLSKRKKSEWPVLTRYTKLIRYSHPMPILPYSGSDLHLSAMSICSQSGDTRRYEQHGYPELPDALSHQIPRPDNGDVCASSSGQACEGASPGSHQLDCCCARRDSRRCRCEGGRGGRDGLLHERRWEGTGREGQSKL